MLMGISDWWGSGKGALLDSGSGVYFIFCGLAEKITLLKGNMVWPS